MPPLILILHEGRIGPLDHRETNVILTLHEVIGHVELGCEVGVLAQPYRSLVDVDDEDALCCADVQHDAASGPGFRYAE